MMAFDKVDHGFLFRVLRRMGVDESIVRTIETIYDKISTKLLINGHLTENISVTRGVRQGCPLSPLLYAIYLEPVLRYIDNEQTIEGISCPAIPRPVKYLAYADDVLILSRHLSSVQTVFKLFEKFELFSGSSLNVNKTKVLTRENHSQHSEVSGLVVDKLKFCGIFFFFSSGKEVASYNWQLKCHAAVAKIQSSKGRKLTLNGKVILLNSCIFSTLHYLSSIYLPDKQSVTSLRKHSFQFLWYPLVAQRVKQEVFFLPKEKGGWGLDHVLYRARCLCLHSTLQRVAMQRDHPVSQLVRYHAARYLRPLFPDKIVLNEGPTAPQLVDQYKKFKIILEEAKDLFGKNVLPTVKQMLDHMLERDKDIPSFCPIKHPNYTSAMQLTNEAQLWQSVHDPYISSKLSDFAWRVVTGCLTTGSVLSSWHASLPAASFNCHICKGNSLETPEHLFFHCESLKEVRKKVVRHLFVTGLITNDDANVVDWLAGVLQKSASKRAATKARSLIFSTNCIIWRVRNDVIHRNKGGCLQQISGQVAKLMSTSPRSHSIHL